jgi:hypothetical protein
MLVTIIGRGHSGTRAMSHTLTQSGVFMGAPQNNAGDLLPPEDLYEACRVMARHVTWSGGLNWDFSKLHTMPIDPRFTQLVESFLTSVHNSKETHRGWKLPETTLIYPWIVRLFPEVKYIHWVRDVRDCILAAHFTDDLKTLGIDYPATEDIFLRRAISWKYQREIIKATPPPKHTMAVRFEDFILKQDETLCRVSKFLNIPLSKIEVRPEAVGRWKTDPKACEFDIFQDDLTELGYEKSTLPVRSTNEK